MRSRSASPVAMPESLPSRLKAFAAMSIGGRERVGKALEAAVVAAGLGEFVEPPLRLLDLVARRGLDGRVVGHVDHVLADPDQIAADGEVVDRAAVVLGVDDGGRIAGETGEVLEMVSRQSRIPDRSERF